MADAVLLAAMLLALAVVAAGVCRKLHLPHSVVLVLVGMGLAELARRWPSVAPDAGLAIGPDLVFFVLLPALVFESGLNLDVRRLLQNLAPVLTLALPAPLLSAAIIGVGLWLATGLDLTVALLFGALISATDPVVVVALFKEMGAPARLTVLVEGESLFNDATAIVVFGLLLAFALEGGLPGAGALARAVPGLALVFVGGAALGVVTGAVASELSHRLRSPTAATLAMSVAAAYASFILAEHTLHVSGVMAAVGASITFAALAITRLGGPERHALAQTWEMVAFVCNALLFLLLGLAVDLSSLLARLPLIATAVVLIHLARAAAVYVLVPLTTRVFALPSVAMGDRHIMWWGGLKGGLAIAIALSVPESLAERQLLLEVTVGVVLFTLLVNAPTLRPLMHRLRLDRFSRDEQAELGDALGAARAQVESRLHAYRADGLLGAETHHVLADEISHALAPPRGGTRRSQTLRAAQLAALNAEADALFQGLSGAGLEALAAECRPMTFLPGDDIVVEGEHGDALYVITRGAVVVSRRVQGGESEPLARLGEGDFFGEAALLGDPVRNATVTADDAATVLRLQRAEVLALTDEHPEIGARLREADQQRRAAPG